MGGDSDRVLSRSTVWSLLVPWFDIYTDLFIEWVFSGLEGEMCCLHKGLGVGKFVTQHIEIQRQFP